MDDNDNDIDNGKDLDNGNGNDRTHAPGPPRHRLGAPLGIASALLLLLVLTGCSGGSGSSGSSDSSASSAGGSATLVAPGAAAEDTSSGTRAAVQERAVVSNGSVSLTSKDVAGVRTRVDRLLATYDGFVADEQTGTDRRGRPEHTTLTVRVPSRSFDTVMRRLAGLGTLVDSSRKAEDVTTQVIDVGQRISAQQAGLRRLRQLVSTSGSLSALLAVEKQVTDRQADLDSLVQQRAYLSDQTSLATISLDVERAHTPPVAAHGGFLGGLRDGWAAMLSVLGAMVRVAGAALPFAVVALVLWLPVRAVVRRFRRFLRRGNAQPAPLPGAPAVS